MKLLNVNEEGLEKCIFLKKTIWISLLVIILFGGMAYAFGNATSSQISSSYRIKATLVNQEPDPVGPGEVVEVRLKFENKGGENAEDITVELLPDYPFSLYTNEGAVKQIGSIYGRQIGETGVIVKYKLKVDENAVEGENELELRYKIGNDPWIKLDAFKIDIQTEDAILSINDVKTKTEMIKPGEKGIVDITLENMADSLLRDIKVKLDLNDVPIAPIGSTNEKTIKKLIGGEEAVLRFYLMAEPDADSKLYKIPVYINYMDELEKKYFKNSTIGIVVGDEPDLSVTLDNSDIYRSKSGGKIVIKFVNKGVTDIKFLNVKLGHSKGYRIISQDEIYVGNIDSDDYETAEFEIFAEKTKSKEIALPILVEYKDSNNNDYAKEISLDLRLYSAAEAKQLGLAKGSSAVGIFIMIVIVAGGFFGYRKWRKRRKVKK